MSKIILNDVVGGYNLSTINTNFQKIEEALNDEVLYRDNPIGEPNSLASDIDANGKKIINLPDPTSDTEPATKGWIVDTLTGQVDEAVEDAEAAALAASNSASSASGYASSASASAIAAANSAEIAANSTLNWMGNWDENTEYEENDAVMYEGSSFRSLSDNVGILPTDIDYWILIAAKGVDGASGSGTGDVSSNTASSVNSEVVLFSGTNGKTIKRATGSGIVKLINGVLAFAQSGTDYLTSVTWGIISGKPTTIAGYGITDAAPKNTTLEAAAGSAILPSTGNESLVSKIQSLRNNVKELFSYFTAGILKAVNIPSATESDRGGVILATPAEVVIGTDDTKAVTSEGVKAAIDATETLGIRITNLTTSTTDGNDTITLSDIGLGIGDSATLIINNFSTSGSAQGQASMALRFNGITANNYCSLPDARGTVGDRISLIDGSMDRGQNANFSGTLWYGSNNVWNLKGTTTYRITGSFESHDVNVSFGPGGPIGIDSISVFSPSSETTLASATIRVKKASPGIM